MFISRDVVHDNDRHIHYIPACIDAEENESNGMFYMDILEETYNFTAL